MWKKPGACLLTALGKRDVGEGNKEREMRMAFCRCGSVVDNVILEVFLVISSHKLWSKRIRLFKIAVTIFLTNLSLSSRRESLGRCHLKCHWFDLQNSKPLLAKRRLTAMNAMIVRRTYSFIVPVRVATFALFRIKSGAPSLMPPLRAALGLSGSCFLSQKKCLRDIES